MAEIFNFEKNFDFELQYGGRVRYFHQFFFTSAPGNQLAFIRKTRFVNSTSGFGKLSRPNGTSRNFFEFLENSPKIHFQGQDLRILTEGRGPSRVSSGIFLTFQEIDFQEKIFFEVFWSTFNFSEFRNLIFLILETKVSKIMLQMSAKFQGPRCHRTRDI